MEMRVFWAVLCALLVFSGISAVWYALSVRGTTAVVSHVTAAYVNSAPVRTAASYTTATVQGYVDAATTPLQKGMRRLAVVDQARALGLSPPPPGMRLAPDQRCVGNTVVQVANVKGVPTFSQLTQGGHPVMCPR